MELIRANFLADDVLMRKNTELRRRAVLAYICMWLVAILVIFVMAIIRDREAREAQQEILAIRTRIEQEAPQYFLAIEAYNKYHRFAQGLATAHNNAAEIGFIARCLQGISETIPDNFWLEQISFQPTDTTVFDDRIEKPAKLLTLKGKLYFDLSVKNENLVREFEEGLSRRTPFSVALNHLDLNYVEVGRFDDDGKFYHTFTLHYGWPGPLF